MINNGFLKFFEAGSGAVLPKFFGISFDLGACTEIQRKNLQALTETQRLALEGLQSLLQQQTQMISGLVESGTGYAREIVREGTPEQKIARQIDLVKKNYERAVESWAAAADLIRQTNRDAAGLINGRVTGSMNEIKTFLEKEETPAASNSNRRVREAA